VKIPDHSSLARWSNSALLPVLVLLMVLYYRHGMSGYVAPIWMPDEFGYLSVAAFLNGHDWTAVAHGLPWYSYGYSLLLAPAFALTKVSHWYRDAQWVNLALIAMIGICANLVLRKLDRTSKPWLRHVTVALILLYPPLLFNARFAWTETLVAVMPWLLGLLVFRTFEARRRHLDAFLCGALLMASYYIHARLIVLVIAGLIVFAFMLVKDRCWRELAWALLGMLVVLVPAYWFKDFLIANLYGGVVGGAQDSPLKMLGVLFRRAGELAAWRDVVGSAAGQLAYQLIATLGLLVVGVVATLQALRRHYAAREWAGFATLAFLLLGAVGSYALVLLTMGMSPQYPQHVFYGRYTEPLVLPIVAIGLLHLYRKPRSILPWTLLALAFVCVLVPIGVQAASRLPHQTTYWTAILGLFTYRSPHWYLETEPLLVGFLVVAITMILAFRVHRTVGLALVATLFFCGGLGLVRYYAPATSSYVQKWRAWPLPGTGNPVPRVIRLETRDQSLFLLATRIQIINAGSVVIPPNAALPDHFSGEYEQMVLADDHVVRSACLVDSPGPPSCTQLAAPPPASIHLAFLEGRSVTVHRARLSQRAQQFLVALPYLRAVWDDLALHHVTVHYAIRAPTAQGLSIKVYVTRAGESQPLASRTAFRYVPEGIHAGSVRVPVPVRIYTGGRLEKGFYTLHAVVAGPDGDELSTMVSLPMRIR
jgi:hypothetical protein